ncbi:MAG: hypothetical protein E6H07_12795 [Bacteroidetes bacterium]|nr:MAG: hypothetical protein E6H07_12795 [Bacteroidota bacterium]
MENDFLLPVTFQGKEREFPVRFLNYGYSSKLEVEIDGTKILFEPDEERNWRALISYEDLVANKNISRELLEAVAGVIEEITK